MYFPSLPRPRPHIPPLHARQHKIRRPGPLGIPEVGAGGIDRLDLAGGHVEVRSILGNGVEHVAHVIGDVAGPRPEADPIAPEGSAAVGLFVRGEGTVGGVRWRGGGGGGGGGREEEQV